MEIAKWDDTYKTGYAPVDIQHREMFRLINKLHDAILAKKDREILSATLEGLTNYTRQHFRAEEALMSSVNYPNQSDHKRKHERLTQEVKTLVEDYETGKAVLSITLGMFLAKWWRDHITHDDMALIRHVQEHRRSRNPRPTVVAN